MKSYLVRIEEYSIITPEDMETGEYVQIAALHELAGLFHDGVYRNTRAVQIIEEYITQIKDNNNNE